MRFSCRWSILEIFIINSFPVFTVWSKISESLTPVHFFFWHFRIGCRMYKVVVYSFFRKKCLLIRVFHLPKYLAKGYVKNIHPKHTINFSKNKESFRIIIQMPAVWILYLERFCRFIRIHVWLKNDLYSGKNCPMCFFVYTQLKGIIHQSDFYMKGN